MEEIESFGKQQRAELEKRSGLGFHLGFARSPLIIALAPMFLWLVLEHSTLQMDW